MNRAITQEKDTRETKTGFRTVHNRRRRRENQRDGDNFIRGTKKEEEELQAAERMAWI